MLSKVYTERLVTKKLCLSGFLDVLLDIVIDKCLNLFDECVARCVYILPKEEEWTSSAWGDCKTYLYDTIANSDNANWQKTKRAPLPK